MARAPWAQELVNGRPIDALHARRAAAVTSDAVYEPIPPWWRPGLLLIVIGAIALSFADTVLSRDWSLPTGLIICSGIAIVPTLYRVFRKPAEAILADHFFVLACAFLAYYVIGALLIPLGPRDEADVALSFYWVDTPLAMRVIAANCIGCGLAFLTGSLIGRDFISRLSASAVMLGQSFRPEWVIVAFLVIGGAARVYVLAFEIGLREGIAIGIVASISKLLLVAIMVAAAYRSRTGPWLLFAACTLTSLFSIGGLLTFDKSGVLLPLVALLAGLAWRVGARRVLVPGTVLLATVFVSIGDPVTLARQVYGLRVEVSWADRLDIILEGLTQSRVAALDPVYTPWARFCYLPIQGAAMDLYDAGQGDDDYRRMWWVFVPRLLFPEKPIISESVVTFDWKVSGRDLTSAAGHGVFVNGYYNLGWLGVALVGGLVGWILAWSSAIAAQVFRVRALIWLPVALQGSFMAFRIDGHFLADYWGIFALVIYAVVGGAALTRILRKRPT